VTCSSARGSENPSPSVHCEVSHLLSCAYPFCEPDPHPIPFRHCASKIDGATFFHYCMSTITCIKPRLRPIFNTHSNLVNRFVLTSPAWPCVSCARSLSFCALMIHSSLNSHLSSRDYSFHHTQNHVSICMTFLYDQM
jgi:hypothetical protein